MRAPLSPYRLAAAAAAVLAAGACGGDGGVARDLGAPDLRADLAAPDLGTPPDLVGAAEDLGDDGEPTSAHGDTHRFVVKELDLPHDSSDRAIDLNGDKKPDNQLGNVLSILAAQGFDAQAAVDQSIAAGDTIVLLDVQSADATLLDDDRVGVTVRAGLPTPQPDFSGAGTFAVDKTVAPGTVYGPLHTGSFVSTAPPITKHPATVTLKLPLFSGGQPIVLPLNGARVSFTHTGKELVGQINGSVKKKDIDDHVIPALAQFLTAQVLLDPTSQTAKTILSLFDTGGCTNPDGTKAVAGDQKIDTCEVAQNALIQNVLAPDVQIFDGQGHYAPSPANTQKDSLSVGVGFVAVGAKP